MVSIQWQLPGHFRFLPQQQQNGLGVDQQCPAGQTEEQQDQDALLKGHSNTQQVPRPKCLSRGNTHTHTHAHAHKGTAHRSAAGLMHTHNNCTQTGTHIHMHIHTHTVPFCLVLNTISCYTYVHTKKECCRVIRWCKVVFSKALFTVPSQVYEISNQSLPEQ